MFDPFGGGPDDWEPIPDEVFDELGPWDDADVPAGLVPAISDPDDLVWQAVGRTLGTETLPLLTAVPFRSLTDQGRSVALRRIEELTAHLEAVKSELTAVIAGPTPPTPELRHQDYSAHEISVATRCSVYAADDKISFARDLTERLKATAIALANGLISERQAQALSEATCHLDIGVAREVEAKLLRFSHRQDLTLFKLSLRRWMARIDPDWVARATAARRDCVVDHTARDDGTGELFIRGPLEITTAVSMALTAYAAKTRSETGGTAAQRKLAGLRELTDRYLDAPDCPKLHGRLPVLTITIDLPTVLGMRDNPAEIPGVGAVPADVVRFLLADGSPLRRLIIDPDGGQLLEYGTKSYVVPPALADRLIARNITSASPHSAIASSGCDMEHNTPHGRGGATNPLNTTPIDRRWHRAKTHGGWTYTKHPDTGVVTWQSPTSGLTCQINPYDYRAGP